MGKKKNTKIYPLEISELLFISSLCKELGYVRENMKSCVYGKFSSLKVKNKNNFNESDIKSVKDKFIVKFNKRLIFNISDKNETEFNVGFFTKIDK